MAFSDFQHRWLRFEQSVSHSGKRFSGKTREDSELAPVWWICGIFRAKHYHRANLVLLNLLLSPATMNGIFQGASLSTKVAADPPNRGQLTVQFVWEGMQKKGNCANQQGCTVEYYATVDARTQ